MKSKIQISIPTPCHENWQNMTVVDKGRFCASCRKNVIDFTKSSDREIVKAFDTNNNVCGRFNDSQLNRDLFVPKEKNTIWIAAASGVLAFLGLGEHKIYAQQITFVQAEEKPADIIPPQFPLERIDVIGRVRNDDYEAMKDVLITISGYDYETRTDSKGNFSISMPKGAQLNFIKESHEQVSIELDSDRGHLEIFLSKPHYTQRTTHYAGGAISISCSKKRTFLGRIFHSIGNLFK
jgi:hypothetical protein